MCNSECITLLDSNPSSAYKGSTPRIELFVNLYLEHDPDNYTECLYTR